MVFNGSNLGADVLLTAAMKLNSAQLSSVRALPVCPCRRWQEQSGIHSARLGKQEHSSCCSRLPQTPCSLPVRLHLPSQSSHVRVYFILGSGAVLSCPGLWVYQGSGRAGRRARTVPVPFLRTIGIISFSVLSQQEAN